MSTNSRKKANPHSRKSLSMVVPKEEAGSRITDILALRSAFTTTPPHTATTITGNGSVYVSGHLTPADQWVAVGASESSGVISLTTSDNEDDDYEVPANAQYKQIRHDSAHPPTGEEERAVSLLRESVASLLSSSGGGSPASTAPAGRHMQRRGSTGGRYIGRRNEDSPDIRSKISEPCYATSRRPGFNVDRFADINLSNHVASMPAPPTQPPPLPCLISNSYPSEMTSMERSPFASLRTISPVIVESSDAQIEAMLEKTILCPITEGRYNWTRYTSYAVAGFGVGTLVGMLCLDIAASSASVPRATKTVPLSGL